MAVNCEIDCHFFYIHNMSIKKLYNNIYADIQYWIADIWSKCWLYRKYVYYPNLLKKHLDRAKDITTAVHIANLPIFKKHISKSLRYEIIVRYFAGISCD